MTDTATLVIQLGSLIGALTVITGIIVKTMKKWLIKELSDLKADLKEKIYEDDKTYLTDFLADVERGCKKTEVQKQRASEIYGRYTSPKYNGNTYVQKKWEKLMK